MDGSGLTGPTIPDQWRAVHRGSIHVGRHAVLGANVVVHPDVTIGEGTIVGSQSLVTKNLPPWSICFGVPARVVRERDSRLFTSSSASCWQPNAHLDLQHRLPPMAAPNSTLRPLIRARHRLLDLMGPLGRAIRGFKQKRLTRDATAGVGFEALAADVQRSVRDSTNSRLSSSERTRTFSQSRRSSPRGLRRRPAHAARHRSGGDRR